MNCEIKNYLSQVYRANELMDSKENQILYLRDITEKTNTVFNASGVKNKDLENKKETIICKIIDLSAELGNDICSIVNAEEEITHLIKKVQNTDHQLLLQYRYLNFKTWAEIADLMGFTTQWINVLHNRAIKDIENIIIKLK